MSEIDVILKVCEKILEVDLSKRTRERDFVFKRAIFFKVCRHTLPKHTLQSISASVNYNHATAIHGIKLFNNEIRKYEYYYNLYKSCLDESSLKLKESVQSRKLDTSDIEVNDLLNCLKDIMEDAIKIQGKIKMLSETLNNNNIIIK